MTQPNARNNKVIIGGSTCPLGVLQEGLVIARRVSQVENNINTLKSHVWIVSNRQTSLHTDLNREIVVHTRRWEIAHNIGVVVHSGGYILYITLPQLEQYPILN